MSEAVKLGRVGHYSYQQSCQRASICFVNADGTVNVDGATHEGDHFSRRNVPVGASPESPHEEFHFNRECPWER